MAWGRKKSGGRQEPLFGVPAALAELRLSPEDRIPAASDVDDEKPKKQVAKRKPVEDDDEPPPRERKPRAAKSSVRSGAKRRAKSRGRFSFKRLIYWGAVLGL